LCRRLSVGVCVCGVCARHYLVGNGLNPNNDRIVSMTPIDRYLCLPTTSSTPTPHHVPAWLSAVAHPVGPPPHACGGPHPAACRGGGVLHRCAGTAAVHCALAGRRSARQSWDSCLTCAGDCGTLQRCDGLATETLQLRTCCPFLFFSFSPPPPSPLVVHPLHVAGGTSASSTQEVAALFHHANAVNIRLLIRTIYDVRRHTPPSLLPPVAPGSDPSGVPTASSRWPGASLGSHVRRPHMCTCRSPSVVRQALQDFTKLARMEFGRIRFASQEHRGVPGYGTVNGLVKMIHVRLHIPTVPAGNVAFPPPPTSSPVPVSSLPCCPCAGVWVRGPCSVPG
jgi:hypothetical protein